MTETRLCSIPDCGKPWLSSGYCSSHYWRMHRHGSPFGGGRAPNEVRRFFDETVLNYKDEECLLWPYARGLNGYGIISSKGVNVPAHRHLCEAVNGPAPTPEHQAAHSCGKGHLGCVTPKHLSWKMPVENCADKLIHGTHQRGERNASSKLTEASVREIIALKGTALQREIAKLYGVSHQQISSIHRGETWGWISSSARPPA